MHWTVDNGLTKDDDHQIPQTQGEELLQMFRQGDVFILQGIRFNAKETRCNVIQGELLC